MKSPSCRTRRCGTDVESRVLPLRVGAGTLQFLAWSAPAFRTACSISRRSLCRAFPGAPRRPSFGIRCLEAGGVPDERQFFGGLDGPQFGHDIVASHEVVAQLGVQMFVEGDGHIIDADDANPFVEYLVLAHDRHRLLRESAGALLRRPWSWCPWPPRWDRRP